MDEISVEKVGQLLLEVPQLLTAAARDELEAGVNTKQILKR